MVLPRHPDYKPIEPDSQLSELCCFPIANCVLAAVKARYVNNDRNRSLDELFREKFLQLKTRYLHEDAVDKTPPQTDSDLSLLQDLIDNSVLHIHQDAFDCILYQREREWFPTNELALILDPSAGTVEANKIVRYIVDTIVDWYKVDPKRRFWDRIF